MLSSWTKNETLISCCFDKWPWTPFPTTKLWRHSDALMSLLWNVKDSLSLFQIVPASQVTRNQGQLIHANCFRLFILPLDEQSFKLNSCLAKPALPCTINLKREFHVYYAFVNQCYWASKFLKWWCCSLSQKKLLEFLNAMFARKLLLSKKDCHCHVWNGWFCGSHKVLCRHGLLTKTKTQQTAVQVLLPSEPAPANPFGVLCSHSKVQ